MLETREGIWTDAKNNRYRISQMSDEYIRNCIVFIQRRIDLLDNVEWNCNQIEDEKQALQDKSAILATSVAGGRQVCAPNLPDARQHYVSIPQEYYG